MPYQATRASKVLNACVLTKTISLNLYPEPLDALNACIMTSKTNWGLIGFATGYISLKKKQCKFYTKILPFLMSQDYYYFIINQI